ncbi:MAG: hypothetical protein IPJ66_10090 [Bacteroidetes bacterium]|nr:hypothetical protein [Bacteroidota bacterium]
MKKIFMFSAVYFCACAFNFLFAQGTWIQKADFGGSNRCDVVSFSIDTKGYVGTGRNSITTLEYADFWEYDPASNVWSQKADFGGGARHAAVAFSIGNKGYVGTGVSLNGPVYFNDFYEYDPNSNSWIQVSSFPASARHSAVGFAIGDKGYVGTGYDGTWKIDFGNTARQMIPGYRELILRAWLDMKRLRLQLVRKVTLV